MGPLDTRVRKVDQCSRTTSSRSVDRIAEKGSLSSRSMGSSASSGWGVVSSHLDRFGKGGSLTSTHAVRTFLIR